MATCIVSPEFCIHPYHIVLVIDRDFRVADINGNILFNVEKKFFTLHNRHILLDAADNPILTFKQKIRTAHHRWNVFRGDSSDEKDLLFSVKKSSMFQLKPMLEVFLASNTSEYMCDFKVKRSWLEGSCTIHAGDSTYIIAQMQKMGTYRVTVYPKVDFAFIVALIFIREQINKKDDVVLTANEQINEDVVLTAIDLTGQVLQNLS